MIHGIVFAPGVNPEPYLLSLWESNECLLHSVHLFHLVLVASGSLLAVEKGLAVLVETQVGDNAVAGVDGDLGLLAVHLLLNELLNVDAPFATVNFSDFALTVLVGSADDLDGVAVAHGDGASRILRGQLFAQLGGHHSPAEGGWCGEVSLSRLSALAGHVYTREGR